ncbi:glucosamine-6-phosphate deaminase [Stieleria sp. TO1_6]|uniref:glucosamine-6-phosphate deaminase n=1 Tax=Stieleria tagensis TaxID=2956795 RepID=UPI00209AFAF1|nr:glucosamine-6-phosphate deaminase [Stieleria tagensis]MCO8122908.1 glucosamine-6-phosphate deaminase [Stieleria tagensis]
MNQEFTLNAMRTIVCQDAQGAAKTVAGLIADQVRQNPKSVLGLATGGTPVATYQVLIEMARRGEVDFRQVTSFNLDEYIGLAGDHPQSFRAFMDEQLFGQINIPIEQTFVPDGCASDIDASCARYEAMIRDAGGIDMQLLGIGHNGHIAFNEPGSEFDSRTRQVELTAETIDKNARFFDSPDQVPRHAITMGIATILDARQIVLLATGAGKADAVRNMLAGPVVAAHPASLLRNHSHVTVVLDPPAAAAVTELQQ